VRDKGTIVRGTREVLGELRWEVGMEVVEVWC
jgi:hypothetical protein